MPDASPSARFALLIALVAMGALSIDITIPALPEFARAFGTDAATAQLTLSVFVGGFALSQLAYGPLSDRFGRKPVLIAGLLLYALGSAACVVATDIGELIAARFVQSLGCCAGPVLARAMVRDVYGREGSARVLAYLGSVMALIPAAAPVAGGFLVAAFQWQAVFIVLLGFALLSLTGTLLVLDETNRWKDALATAPRHIISTYAGLISDRTYLAFVGALTGTYAGMFSFHSLSAFVLIEQFGVAPQHYGFYFIALVAGFVTGTTISARRTLHLGLERMVSLGCQVQLGAAIVLCALGWLRIDATLAVIGPMAVFMIGCGFVFPNATAGCIGPHATKAGSASALLGFLQFASAAATGWLVALFHDGTQRAMVSGVLLGSCAALLLFKTLAPPTRHPPSAGNSGAGARKDYRRGAKTQRDNG